MPATVQADITATFIQPAKNNLVDLAELPQPVGVIKSLPPITTSRVPKVAKEMQLGTNTLVDGTKDDTIEFTGHLSAEAQEAISTTLPQEETDTNKTAEIDIYTTPAIDDTAFPTFLILDHLASRA